MLLLTILFSFNHNVAQGDGESCEWHLDAAKAGNVEAKAELEWNYYEGISVKRSYAEAVRWSSAAAQENELSAKVGLGISYLYGTGVKRDYKIAVSMFEDAVNYGDLSDIFYYDAAFLLGFCYYDGLGVTIDQSKATLLWRKAGQPTNPTGAVRWYREMQRKWGVQSREEIEFNSSIY